MNALLDWLANNKDALTILGGAITALAAGAWALYRFRTERRSKRETPNTMAAPPTAVAQGQIVQVFGIPFSEFREALGKREAEIRVEMESVSASGTARLGEELSRTRAEAEQYRLLADQLEYVLAQLQADMQPPPLAPELFPESLRVVSFIPHRELKVGILASPEHRAGAAIFGALWTGFGTFILVGATGAPPVLAPVVFGLVFWKLFTTWQMTFDFTRKRLTIVSPGSIVWKSTATPVTVTARKAEDGWCGSVMSEDVAIAHGPVCQTEADARAALLPFVRALNWEMGMPLLTVDLPRATPRAGK